MKLDKFIQKMPKVELHVHLKGSIRPETLLNLAEGKPHALRKTKGAKIGQMMLTTTK